MKKRSALVLAALVAIAAPQAIEATPYASNIRLASTSFAAGAGTTITYVLNQAATSTTIEIIDPLNNVVASFAGTATAGSNSVVWNGTVDNASGAIVPTGTGYRVRITANGPSVANWTRYKAQGATTSLPPMGDTDLATDWWPKGLTVNRDPDSDHFGNVYVGFGYQTLQPAAAIMEFTADLEVKAGDNGLASRIMRHPGDDEVAPNPASYTVWGVSFDPEDSNRLWYTGQATSNGNTGAKEYFTGVAVNGVFPQFATDADPSNVVANGQFPRGLTIHRYGTTRYGFITFGNATVLVVTLDANNNFATLVGNILSTTGWTNANTRYSKNTRFDSAGNMYWGSQRINQTVGSENGKVYRWTAAAVQAAIANPGSAPLTEANASAIVINDHVGVNQRVAGFEIHPISGDVYVFTPAQGMFNVGNTNTLSGTINLSLLSPLLINTDFRPTNGNINAGTSDFWFDAVGNLVVCDGASENVFAFAPPSAVPTTTTFVAPPSQTFTITASTADWEVLN
jgi:hypothetical protein